MTKPKIYVAGPMSKGDLHGHIRDAVRAGDAILRAGGIPFLPQIGAFWNLISPHPYETWMEFDFAWLDTCEMLLRIPGESPGADREVARAYEMGIPVYDTLLDVLKAVRGYTGILGCTL